MMYSAKPGTNQDWVMLSKYGQKFLPKVVVAPHTFRHHLAALLVTIAKRLYLLAIKIQMGGLRKCR